MPGPPPTVTLYGKAGCHLCDEARTAIASVAEETPLRLEEVDVSLDPALARRYGERVPVVCVDGEELFEYRVDPLALRRRVDIQWGR